MNPKLFLACDPGLTGAVAAIGSNGRFVGLFDIPTKIKESKSKKGTKAKVKRKVDGLEFHDMLLNMTDLEPEDVFMILESQVAMPPTSGGKMGTASLMSLGDTFGSIRTSIEIAKIPYKEVNPRSWKGMYKIPGEKDGGKKYALSLARMLFPQAPLKLMKHHNRAEALLLAKYAFDTNIPDI